MKNMTNTIWFKSILLILFMLPILGILTMVDHGRVVTADETANNTDHITTSADTTSLAPNCRYGVTSSGGHVDDIFPQLGIGWALDFGVANRTYPNGIDRAQVVRFRPDGTNGYRIVSPGSGLTGLDNIIRQNRGALWLIGNEVDRKDVQDDLYPDVYARAYRDVYRYIKQRDHTARIAISGLVQVSPGRLQYLDLVWNSYQQQFGEKIPVDVWNMHAYTLPELDGLGNDGAAAVANGTDPNLATRYLRPGEPVSACDLPEVVCFKEEDSIPAFINQVQSMRQWMKQKGEQNKPLIISEFSILAPYNPEEGIPGGGFLRDEDGRLFTRPRVTEFMLNIYQYLETATDPNLGYPADNNRLVQQWMWFTLDQSLPDHIGSASSFVQVSAPWALNEIGQAHRNWVSSQTPTENVIMAYVSNGAGAIQPPTNTGSATIFISVRNNGNMPTNNNTLIYIRDQNGNTVGTTSVSMNLRGCAMHIGTTSFTFNNLSPGFHSFTAHINNSDDPIKMGSGVIFIGSEQLFLPIALR